MMILRCILVTNKVLFNISLHIFKVVLIYFDESIHSVPSTNIAYTQD